MQFGHFLCIRSRYILVKTLVSAFEDFNNVLVFTFNPTIWLHVHIVNLG